MHSSLLKTLTFIITILGTSSLLADNGKPDLWRVEKDGNTSYLFGSIHVGSDDFYPMSEEVNTAYQSTDNLVVEVDLKPGDEAKIMSLIQRYGLDSSSPLEQRLSPETLAIFKQVCKEDNLPCEEFAPFKAWLVSVTLSVMKIKQIGYNEALGIDKHFLALAHKSNKHVISLETAESQVQIFGRFSQEVQELMLVNSLLETDEYLLDLVNAWKSGDDDLMYSLLNKNADDPVGKEMLRVLINDRNINMASQISEYIKARKSLFVVVGYGHIISKNGIVELLKKDGFTLTLIQ